MNELCKYFFYGCNECSCYSVIIPYHVGTPASEGPREFEFNFGAELNDMRQTSLSLGATTSKTRTQMLEGNINTNSIGVDIKATFR